MCEAAMLAKTTETIKSGKASIVARPKSYKAAKAVKTSVVNTRTRNRPGTENSEIARTKMTNAVDTTLGATSGQVIRFNTRPGVATRMAASSSLGSIWRTATSVASIASG